MPLSRSDSNSISPQQQLYLNLRATQSRPYSQMASLDEKVRQPLQLNNEQELDNLYSVKTDSKGELPTSHQFSLISSLKGF
jgi:hypothetical protein